MWKEKLLSQGGQETLIKAAVLSIPMYAMNWFRLPISLCTEMKSLMTNF